MPSSIEAAGVASPRSGWLAGLGYSLRENCPLLLLVVVSLTAANGLSAALGRPHRALDHIGHVASIWLIARMFQTYGRRAAVAAWSFFAVILLGSVHLGWHYALDGYVSIAGAWALWRSTGWLLDRPTVQAFLWPKDWAPARTKLASA